MLLIFIRIQKFKLNLCNDEFLEDKSMPRDEPKCRVIAARRWTQLIDAFLYPYKLRQTFCGHSLSSKIRL